MESVYSPFFDVKYANWRRFCHGWISSLTSERCLDCSLAPIRRIVIFPVNDVAVQLQMPEEEQAQDNSILKNHGLLTYEVQKNARFVAAHKDSWVSCMKSCTLRYCLPTLVKYDAWRRRERNAKLRWQTSFGKLFFRRGLALHQDVHIRTLSWRIETLVLLLPLLSFMLRKCSNTTRVFLHT